jgi:lipid II:glycine glycyltransferase (peptidoglycan interpeptide bridge formation enzyme)
MINLSDGGYTAQFDPIDADKWQSILQQFDDANIYQTPSYAQNRWPRSELIHMILTQEGNLIAAAQIRLLVVPMIRGIAYLRWGPLWRRSGLPEDIEVFRQAIRTIRHRLVVELGFTVQIVPRITEDRSDLQRILEDEGFRCTSNDYNTVLIDISGTEDEIRSRLVPRWRTDLNRSQRNKLKLAIDSQLDLYDRFAPIYLEMHERKNLVEFGDLEVYRDIQSDLHEHQKMSIMLCSSEGELDGAGAITSAMGDTGLAILWATNHEGRENRGAYYLQWEIIRWLKQQNCQWYDLGGVGKEANPGGYRFKCGLAGKNGREIRFLGQFQSSPNRIHGLLLEAAVVGRDMVRALRKFAKKLFSRPGQ